jgi:Zn-dependent protease
MSISVKEIQARAGSFAGSGWYVFLVFCWYFLDNLYTTVQPISPGSWIEPLLVLAARIGIYPVLLAGVFGGIHEQQQTQDSWDLSGFFTGIRKHILRLMGANLLGFIFTVGVTVVLLTSGIIQQPDLADNRLLQAVISIPYSAVTLFWLAAITAERKFFPALFQAVKTLALNPLALLIGIAWGAIGFAETFYFDSLTTPIHPAVNGARAAGMAVARILAVVYALAVYKQAQGISPDAATEESGSPQASRTLPGEAVVNAGFGFALVSCLPFMHLIALSLGLVAILKKKRLGLRSALACGLGGFFTIFYALILAGWLITGAAAPKTPQYTFLSEVSAPLKPQTLLLEQGSFQAARDQLEQVPQSANRSWAVDCASALAKLHSGDQRGALEDFWAAAAKDPERSEFYYHYGVALLENGQEERAKEQFQLALTHEPRLEEAEQYLTLLNTQYSPTQGATALLFIIILVVSFSFHEYGHAWMAWKLGDDTAERQGRLTLNPIQHLDPFGSILLPAILLFQQSGMIFSWAKPVPVDPRNFKNPQRDHMRVAFAGPAVNLLLAMICFILLGSLLLFVRLFWPETISLNLASPDAPVSIVGPGFSRWLTVIVVFIKQALYSSLVLGCLNLIPVPPLDGSWILSGLLPERYSQVFEKIRGFSSVLFLLLIMTPVLGYLLAVPMGLAWGGLQLLVSAMGFG